MSIPMTIALGIAGSFIGGLLVYAVSGGRSAGGFFAAFVCTVGLVYLVRRSARRQRDVRRPDADARPRAPRSGARLPAEPSVARRRVEQPLGVAASS